MHPTRHYIISARPPWGGQAQWNCNILYCRCLKAQRVYYLDLLATHPRLLASSLSNSLSISITLSPDPCRALAWLSGQLPTKLHNITTNNNVGSWRMGERGKKERRVAYCTVERKGVRETISVKSTTTSPAHSHSWGKVRLFSVQTGDL